MSEDWKDSLWNDAAEVEVYYVTPEEYAKIMRLSTRTVYELLRKGEIQALKIGRQWRIPQERIKR